MGFRRWQSKIAGRVLLSAIALCGWLPVSAQQVATITFMQDFPGSDPSHYVISISSDGHASYEGNGRLLIVSGPDVDDTVPDSERVEFTASASLISRSFDLAKRAQYFQGAVDSGKKNLAFTGEKTLTYKDAERNTHTVYNYSSLPAIQQLTRIFQNLSSTLESGRRLTYYYRHQKLALDQEVKHVEDSAKDGNLEEVSAIAPILQQIIDDRSVINVVRARAQRLLAPANPR
jgi:hypothetical protein